MHVVQNLLNLEKPPPFLQSSSKLSFLVKGFFLSEDKGQLISGRGFSQKTTQKVLMKIEEMADIFLNSANFASHAFLSLAPPSGYALNLKALIKVSKVS